MPSTKENITLYFCENSATFSDVTTSRSLHLQTTITNRPTSRDANGSFNNTGDTDTRVVYFSTVYIYELSCSKLPLVYVHSKCSASLLITPRIIPYNVRNPDPWRLNCQTGTRAPRARDAYFFLENLRNPARARRAAAMHHFPTAQLDNIQTHTCMGELPSVYIRNILIFWDMSRKWWHFTSTCSVLL